MPGDSVEIDCFEKRNTTPNQAGPYNPLLQKDMEHLKQSRSNQLSKSTLLQKAQCYFVPWYPNLAFEIQSQ